MTMNARRLSMGAALALLLAACSSAEPPPAAQAPEPERAPSVFDPLVGTIDRAKGVQSTVDDQAAEQRRRIEAAER
jgi:hypothetical protein